VPLEGPEIITKRNTDPRSTAYPYFFLRSKSNVEICIAKW